MANLTTAICVQVDKDDKEQATQILQKLGLNMSSLINMTLKQLIMRGKVPFDVSIPKNDDLHNYFTEEELDMAAKELKYIEKHPEEYKSYINIQELKGALLNDEKL